ncbi:MAG: trehalose utilization protein ThuA, partial [Spirochaetota bacterium]
MNITIWNEYRHEKNDDAVKKVYPNGIHQALADHLSKVEGFDVRTATLDEPEHGLPESVVNSTDVMLWWGHMAHGDVSDEVAERVQSAVQRGM